jgi:cytochrome c
VKRMVVASIVILFVAVGLAYAQDRGTAAEAKAMLNNAVAFYKTNSPEKAFAAFNDPKGPFVDKDLYIFAVDLNGKVVAHGAKAGLIGKDMAEIRDPNQKNFIAEILTVAKAKGAGTVTYRWENPQFQLIEEKSSYVEKVDGVILGCGYYRWEPQD